MAKNIAAVTIFYLLIFGAQSTAKDMWTKMTKTYVVVGHEKVTWPQARQRCHQRNMVLVRIESEAEDDFIRSLIRPSEPPGPPGDDEAMFGRRVPFEMQRADFWTDGVLSRTTGQWVWATTGQPFTYVNWVRGAPNNYLGQEECTRLWGNKNYQWDDYFCDARLYYICQTRISSASMPKNMENPMPQESNFDSSDDLLAQIENIQKKKNDPGKDPIQPPAKAPTTTTTAAPPPIPTRPLVPLQGQEAQVPPPHLKEYERDEEEFAYDIDFNMVLGWSEAKRACVDQGMELANVRNVYQARKIILFLQKNGLTNYCLWIASWQIREWRLWDSATATGPKQLNQRPESELSSMPLQCSESERNKAAPARPGSMFSTQRYFYGPKCPVLSASNGLRFDYDRCAAKHHFICEKKLSVLK